MKLVKLKWQLLFLPLQSKISLAGISVIWIVLLITHCFPEIKVYPNENTFTIWSSSTLDGSKTIEVYELPDKQTGEDEEAEILHNLLSV